MQRVGVISPLRTVYSVRASLSIEVKGELHCRFQLSEITVAEYMEQINF